ncbi:lipoyl synthase [Acidobacteriota bacterium]
MSTKPPWLKVKLPTHENYFYVSSLVREHNLNTICQSARCPNVSECWSHRTATFLILGDVCTRDCAFCAVKHGTPAPGMGDEATRVAESVEAMGLRYVVVTSVTRDDLPDGGASHFAAVIWAIRETRPETKIEVLIPDFQGDAGALAAVLEAGPDVLNHNLEVPEALYTAINRSRGGYRRSLRVIERAARAGAVTKSGLMLGLGETRDDVFRTLRDLKDTGCQLLTIGQYLKATKNNSSVVKYYTPDEFEHMKIAAVGMGFSEVEAGPLVRSSYRAHRLYQDLMDSGQKTN